MSPIQQATFGYTIAFIAPGVVVLWGATKFSAEVRTWFGIAANTETTVGGFLFIVLAAVSLGVFVSGVRWGTVDQLLKRLPKTRPPDLDLSGLKDPATLASHDQMNEHFYRYYQFYANMLVALLAAYVMWLSDLELAPWDRPAALVVVTLVAVSLFFSARDSWSRYFEHLENILGVKGRPSA